MKTAICGLMVFVVFFLPMAAWAGDTKAAEKEIFVRMKERIPAEKIKTVDDLYQKWLDVQAGKSSAVIVDLRTEAEFDSGHLQDSSNVDSGHFYTIPDKWPDPEQEIWVLCRTTHRATYFAGMLYDYGYQNVHLVEKGIVGWFEKGYPLVNTYLGEIRVVKYEKKLKETYAYRENK